MSNSAIALVFLLLDFSFVVIVAETTKLGLEHRHCRVRAKKKKTQKPKSTNCSAGQDHIVRYMEMMTQCSSSKFSSSGVFALCCAPSKNLEEWKTADLPSASEVEQCTVAPSQLAARTLNIHSGCTMQRTTASATQPGLFTRRWLSLAAEHQELLPDLELGTASR